ncbi:hypothetical protein DFH08DRAFT_843699 [Mycena albidolilacea]|uniref:Secreted protein n=1 Tax=Mycena albidolilacea TaxID=1033008 RepID=A0AAD7F098_9AGAR|nr:hypothetical protein DFH08DRAFT_843699 [Mycena albidolilacea]
MGWRSRWMATLTTSSRSMCLPMSAVARAGRCAGGACRCRCPWSVRGRYRGCARYGSAGGWRRRSEWGASPRFVCPIGGTNNSILTTQPNERPSYLYSPASSAIILRSRFQVSAGSVLAIIIRFQVPHQPIQSNQSIISSSIHTHQHLLLTTFYDP